jgi:mRNA-degrading endonuclease toxin of MazEF toxin-antitoxin module
VIVIPCSTRLRPGPTHVFLRAGEGGVDRECVVKCQQITTVQREDVVGPALGRSLSRARIAEVERAVLRAIGVPVLAL